MFDGLLGDMVFAGCTRQVLDILKRTCGKSKIMIGFRVDYTMTDLSTNSVQVACTVVVGDWLGIFVQYLASEGIELYFC